MTNISLPHPSKVVSHPTIWDGKAEQGTRQHREFCLPCTFFLPDCLHAIKNTVGGVLNFLSNLDPFPVFPESVFQSGTADLRTTATEGEGAASCAAVALLCVSRVWGWAPFRSCQTSARNGQEFCIKNTPVHSGVLLLFLLLLILIKVTKGFPGIASGSIPDSPPPKVTLQTWTSFVVIPSLKGTIVLGGGLRGPDVSQYHHGYYCHLAIFIISLGKNHLPSTTNSLCSKLDRIYQLRTACCSSPTKFGHHWCFSDIGCSSSK